MELTEKSIQLAKKCSELLSNLVDEYLKLKKETDEIYAEIGLEINHLDFEEQDDYYQKMQELVESELGEEKCKILEKAFV